MNSSINNAMVGLINQHQVWVKSYGGKMNEDENQDEKKDKNVEVKVQGGSTSAVYGLGIIGACIFYMGKATTPREKFIGFLKGLVWPVFLVQEALEFLDRE